MKHGGTVYLFGGAYDDVDKAMQDFAAMQAMHQNGLLGGYDAAIVTHEPSGAILASNVDHTGWFTSIAAGAVVGAAVGMAAAVRGVALAGAAGGMAIGPLRMRLTRGNFVDLGDLLQPGESGILIIADKIDGDAAVQLLPQAIRKQSGEAEGGADQIMDAVRRASGQ